jgi:hypothetical protein
MPAKKVVFLSLIPIAIVSIYILLFGLNIPFLDQWEVVGLLEKQQQGALSFSDLLAQHNEHRPFFPRLIWLVLSELTQYNINAQLWANLLIAIGTFGFFVSRSIRTWEQYQVRGPSFLIPVLSLLVFNLGQRESWLQGIQTIMFLGTACVVIGLFLLAEGSDWVRFWSAVLLGGIGTFSMANGLLYWPIGLIVLWILTPPGSRGLRLFLWATASFICIGLFFANWTSGGHLNLTYVLTHPFEWLLWILDFLGSPLMTLWYVAWIFGLLSIVLYILIIRQILRTDDWKPCVPYFAVALFILLTGFSISLGRMEMGMRQAVVPRYLTMSVWYWASLLTLVPLLDMKIQHQRILYSFLTASLIFLTIGGGWRGHVSLYQRILPAYQAISSGQPVSDEVLARISSNTITARSRLHFLCEHKLSVCAEQP